QAAPGKVHLHQEETPTVSPVTGRSLASRKRAQKSVAPPPLMIAARMTWRPGRSVRRRDTPSSITVWRSLYSAITRCPSSHQTEAALEPMDRRTSRASVGTSTAVQVQNSTLLVGFERDQAKWYRFRL